jgi:hypothetical protein
LISEQKLKINDLLEFLPQVREALGANNGWIMCRESGSKSPYHILDQYINGSDSEKISNLKPWKDKSIQNISWVLDSESNLTRPALLWPVNADPLIHRVLPGRQYLILAPFELSGMDYILVFNTPQILGTPAPFDSYHQSFLTTVVCFIKAAYAIGEASKEREIAEKRWQDARKGDSRTAIIKTAQERLSLWLNQEVSSANEPLLLKELDETCADYIEYWRQKLALPNWRRRGLAGVLSERIKDIVDIIDFEPPSERTSYIRINIGKDIEKSNYLKLSDNTDKWFRVNIGCQMTVGAVARAFFWGEASIRYTNKDKEPRFQGWIKNGQTVLLTYAEKDETIWRILKGKSNV